MTAAKKSIAELLNAGITPDAGEAVAIAQALVREGFSSSLPENIDLGSDGSVTCRGCDTTPVVSELALLLRRLLPIGTAGVPGGLYYLIARALREVDAPPLESVEDFSAALARFEQGDSAQLVRGLLARADMSAAPASPPFVERRRTDPTTLSELRRALHEADVRLFEEKVADDIARVPREWSWLAVAACLTAAAAGVAVGDAMHGRPGMPATAAATQTLVVAPTAAPRSVAPHDVVLDAAMPRAAQTTSSTLRSRPGRVESARPRTPAKAAPKRASVDDKPGLLKRLKLQWLRKAFTGQS